MITERQTLTLLMLIQKKHPTDRFWLDATDEIIAAFGPPIDIRHSMKSIWYTFVRPERLSDDDLAFYFNAPPGSKQPGLRPSLKLRLEIELVRSGIQLYEAWPRDPLNYLAIAEASRLATRRVNSVAERARISTTPSPTPFHYGEGTAATLALSAGEALARRRVARVFARALLWNLDNGRFPAKLPVDGADALDPLTGKPLSYYGGELTFTISAVGRDLVPSASSRADIVASYP